MLITLYRRRLSSACLLDCESSVKGLLKLHENYLFYVNYANMIIVIITWLFLMIMIID